MNNQEEPWSFSLPWSRCHHSNNRSDKSDRCQSDKEPFKRMKECANDCRFRIIKIPFQIEAVFRKQTGSDEHKERTDCATQPM